MFYLNRTVSYVKFSGRKNVSWCPSDIISEKNKLKCIEKFTKIQPIRETATQSTRKAAVLVPLCVVNNELSLLYTLRGADMKTHRGQVSFPGGMQEETDETAEHAALRETNEELGIHHDDVDIWCEGKQIVTLNDVAVTPVIGFIKKTLDVEQLKINKKEVDEAFTIPIKILCSKENCKHTQFKHYSMPVFLGGKRRIWGLTGLISHIFLLSLLPPETYNHKIKCLRQIATTCS